MAPKKLSDADRQDILTRYRQPEENTVTIANSYGVSTSTISRILKQNLSEAEYDSLIQQKRSGTHKSSIDSIAQVDLPGIATQTEPAVSLVAEAATPQRVEKPSIPPPRRRQRRRSSDLDSIEAFDPELQSAQLELASVAMEPEAQLDDESQLEPFATGTPVIEKRELEEIEAELGKVSVETGGVDEELDEDDLEDDEDLDEDDLEDDEDLDEDLEDDDLADNGGFSTVQIQREFVRVLPLSEATIPKTCYVVVDRSSELITRPLRDFADLGQIPDEETQERTLPIFDNHRVAKRFTRRMQRVVKVPDGRMFQKVRPYLEAKGITRLLIDGQVYSL